MGNFRPGYLDQGSPLGMTVKNVMLNADNLRIDCTGVSLLALSSDNTTATNRTFVLNASTLVGHCLTIQFVSAASSTAELADSGTAKLAAAWTPLQYDSLTLVSDGTSWVESSRTSVSGAPDLALASAHVFVGNAGGLAADVAMSGDVAIDNVGATTIQANAVTTAKILAANVTLAKLAAGITPSHVVKFAANYTTVGGASAEAITVTGALITDIPFVTMQNDGTGNVTIVSAVLTANTLTVTFSGNPGNDAIISYQVLRAAA